MHGSLGLCECVSCNQATRVLGGGQASTLMLPPAGGGGAWVAHTHSFICPFIRLPIFLSTLSLTWLLTCSV